MWVGSQDTIQGLPGLVAEAFTNWAISPAPSNWFLIRVQRKLSGKRIVFSIYSSGKTGYLHAEEWPWFLPYTVCRKVLKTDQQPPYKSWCSKLLEENVVVKFETMGKGNPFKTWHQIQGRGRGREGNWAFSTQKVCTWKDIVKKTKQQETIFPSLKWK